MPAGEAGESYCMTGSVIKIMMILLLLLLFNINFGEAGLTEHVCVLAAFLSLFVLVLLTRL